MHLLVVVVILFKVLVTVLSKQSVQLLAVSFFVLDVSDFVRFFELSIFFFKRLKAFSLPLGIACEAVSFLLLHALSVFCGIVGRCGNIGAGFFISCV